MAESRISAPRRRTVVVTGASRGIGRAIALAFAARGDTVALTHRRSAAEAERVAAEVEALGGRARLFQADLATDDGPERLLRDAVAALGTINVWVNNAGADILTGEGARLSDPAKLDLLLRVDLRGTVLLSWLVAEHMRGGEGGVILNLSWDQVLTGMPGRPAELFSAAKGGVLAFSKSLARSVAPAVRVHVLAPGWIATGFADQLPEPERRRIAESTPLQRWGTPEDVARAAVFLASPDATFLTGTTLLVDGGLVM